MLRGEAAQSYAGPMPETAQPPIATAPANPAKPGAATTAPATATANAARGTSRLRDRVEPTFGRRA